MDTIWIQYGFNMDSIWIRYGFNMDSIWIQYGFNMDSMWIQYGFNMDSRWIQDWIQSGVSGGLGEAKWPGPACHSEFLKGQLRTPNVWQHVLGI